MSTIHEHPAIQELVKCLVGKMSLPTLIVLQHSVPLVKHSHDTMNYGLIPASSHTQRYTVRNLVFGVLSSQTLVEDDGEDIGTLGIPFNQYSTKREDYDTIKCETGPLWIRAQGEQLCTYCGSAEIHIGAEAIVSWINADGPLNDLSRLQNICQLANALQAQLTQWPPFAECIAKQSTKLLVDVRATYKALQQGARKALQAEAKQGSFQGLTDEYERLAKQLQALTGTAPCDPITFPEFTHPTNA